MKLIYGFNEDISDEDIKNIKEIGGEIKDIIPIIFPPCRNLYFFSKTINRCFADDWGRRLSELENFKFKISSIYDSCGTHPLFFTIKITPDEDITNIIDTLSKKLATNFNPSSFSFTSSPRHIEKRFGKSQEEFKNDQDELLINIHNHPEFVRKLEKIIYKGYKEETSINNIKRRVDGERNRIQENIKNLRNSTKDEKNKIISYIKFTPIINVPILSIIFLKLSSNDCLKKLKNNPKIIDIYKIVGVWNYVLKVWLKDTQELYNFITELHREGSQTSTKCAIRIWRDEFWNLKQPFLAKDPYQPLTIKEKEMLNILGRNEENILLEDRDNQINIFEKKISGASRERLEMMLQKIQNKIWKYSFKLERPGWLQHIVFIKAALGKKEILKIILREKLLGVTHNTFARRYYQITGTFDFIILLDSIDLKELEHKIEKFEEKNLIEDIRISTIIPTLSDNQQKEGPLNPAEAALFNALLPNAKRYDNLPENSVRVKSYNFHLYNSLLYKEDFEKINELRLPIVGTTFITELDPHQMLHVFVRFKMLELENFNNKLKEKQKEFGTYLKIYKPIHDPNIIMCILTANDFNELFKFITDLDIFCKFTEVSLIFDQGFPCKVHESVKCKPCSFCSGTPCEACERYIIAPEKTLYPVANLSQFKGKFENPVKIAVIPIKITQDEFIHLIKTSDEKKQYINKIICNLEKAVKNNAKIIVFPELSIPYFTLEKIEEEIKKIMISNNKKDHPLIVIAGSHYRSKKELIFDKENRMFREKEKIYNVSPILFHKNGVIIKFEQFKNNPCSEPEKEFFEKLKNENIFSQDSELGEGRGCLKFDTVFGRFAVLICHDKDDVNLRNALINEIDVLIVPSWDENKEGTISRLNNLAKENIHSWVIFANNGIKGGSRLFGPVKDKKVKTDEARESLIPSNSGSEDIKYMIIGHGIKTWQKGSHKTEDEHYVYIHPKPEYIKSKEKNG